MLKRLRTHGFVNVAVSATPGIVVGYTPSYEVRTRTIDDIIAAPLFSLLTVVLGGCQRQGHVELPGKRRKRRCSVEIG